MTFLAPSFLWLLPLVGVPFLLHLLNKRPPKLITFSHIKWIQDAHRKRMPKKKLKDILLLIARACALLALILFFARPVIRQGKLIGGQDDNSTLIVLLDVSASMGAVEEGRSSLGRSVTNLKDMLREMPPSARVGLVAYSDRVESEFAPTADRSKILSFLDGLDTVPRPTAIKPALDLAYVMLSRQSKTKKSVLVLTDNQEPQWSALMNGGATIEQFDPTVSVLIWEVGRGQTNHGVTTVSLQLTEEGTLKGGWGLQKSKQERGDVTWQLKLNGGIVGQGSVANVKPGEVLPLEARLPQGGAYSGSLDLAPDSAAFDNTFYVAGRIPKGYRVLVVEGETGLAPSDSESYYLKLALESPRDPRLELMRVVSAETFAPEMLSGTNVLVLANVGNLKGAEDAVNAWTQNGGHLLLTAGSRWQDSRASLGFFRTRAVSSSAQSVAAPQNPAELGLSGAGFEWSSVKVQKYLPVDGIPDADKLLSLGNGDPLLIKKQAGRGSVYFFTSSIDRAWNNLPSKPIYAPLMRELLSRLADPFGEASLLQGLVDQPFELRLPADITTVSVIGPDGTSTAARVDAQGRLRIPPVTKPGLYRVGTSRKDADLTFAVNIDRLSEEGNFERPTEMELEAIFPNAYLQVISPETKSEAFVSGALEGVDATPKLLFLLILFLLIETIVGWPAFAKRAAIAGVFLLSASAWQAWSAEGNRFVYTQLRHSGNWDPYPNAHEGLFEMITSMTNIPLVKGRRVVDLSSSELFDAPSIIVKGNSALTFTAKEKSRLKQYIDRGGLVFFDDTLADAKGPFAESVRAIMRELYPGQPLEKLGLDHAVFRSFFLLRSVAGRRVSQKHLEGLNVGGQGGGEGRTAVIYCANDLLGSWVKDTFGHYIYSCEPGGEPQRWEAFKLSLNIVYFSLTGTYKKDAIHQPFIERKLGL